MNILGTVWDSWWHLLLNVLVAINSVVNVPAVSIILFTLIIKLLTVPLTLKSLRSSRNMQQIQPLIREVQKKYGKDRQKAQEETMRIYQQYGVNPAAGCFPMLVQLPIFFGLYSALSNTITHGADVSWLHGILYNSAWVPAANFNQPFLWIPSLAKADPLFILPVLSGIFQFVQSRMAMPPRDPNNPPDPQTKMMNNMMQFMPLYIIFISANFPTGTVIYWAFSNVFSAVQQYFITGWGSLPSVPGLGFLPRKPLQPLAPPPPPIAATTEATPKKKGVMSWMMDKAIEAQEVQKSQQQNGLTSDSKPEVPTSQAERVKKKGSDPQPPRAVPTNTIEYASDVKHRGNVRVGKNGHSTNGSVSLNGNGTGSETASETPITSAQLPRKRKNKK